MNEVKLTWTALTLFNVDNIKAIKKKTQGVFRLSYTNDGGKNYYVFFVGKSEDIQASLLAYENGRGGNNCITNHLKAYECKFRYAEIEDSEIRESAERQVYKFYQPSCNDIMEIKNENFSINVT